MINAITEYFKSECSKNLVNFHLVDVKITDIDEVLKILRLKFNNPENKSNQLLIENSVVNKEGRSLNLLPYKKLTFKQTLDQNSIVFYYFKKVQLNVSLLLNFFNDMLKHCGGLDKIENVFECLDIGGAVLENYKEFKDIMNNFKIIKHLNLSGTK